MGSFDVVTLSLPDLEMGRIEGVGANPRHLVISPDGSALYVTLNGEGRVAKVDLESGEVLARVRTGNAPRTMTISEDGTALYVVNYNSDTVAKVDSETFEVLEEHAVAHHPIGVTYDEQAREIWVSSYSGVITVFGEQAPSLSSLSPVEVLEGEHVRLRPAVDDDLEALVTIRRTPEVFERWGGKEIEAEVLGDIHSED